MGALRSTLAGHGIVVQPALQEAAHRTGGALGLEGDGAVALVLEGVHFLLHNVGGVAHAAQEQLGVLEHGGADFAVAGFSGGQPHLPLHILPAVGIRRQHVAGATGCLGQHE